MSKKISREEKESIVEFYKSRPMTIENMSNMFNISIPTVMKILSEYKVPRYSKVKLFSPMLDEKYFDIIDTEEKAYFLGFIVTDGCVHKSGKKQSLVALTLQNSDKYILDRLKKEIKSNKNITQDGRGCSEIQILSEHMVNALKQYGVTENKSLHTVLPTNVPPKFYKHIIRGIFDGDGSMSFYARQNRRSHTKAIRLCQGNEIFLLDIVDFLYKECGVEKVSTYREKENLWSIAYRKNDSMIKLSHYIYDDAHIYLTRKKHICDLICNEILASGSTEITTMNKSTVAS